MIHRSRRRFPSRGAARAVLAFGLGACASAAPPATGSAAPDAGQGQAAAIARARADSARLPWTAADARFMTGMIAHHAQALAMSRLAPTRGASPAVLRLASRIVNAQSGEIRTMQQWLRDREQPVPDPADAADGIPAGHADHAAHAGAGGMTAMAGMTTMPGMLTPAQMQELAAARGPAFDELFLRYMIQHHRGAVRMVSELFSTYGAAQDELVFKFASDVNVDQATEIARMEQMLVALYTAEADAPR